MTLALEGGDIVIGAKADGLDKAADGSWTIIDYKQDSLQNLRWKRAQNPASHRSLYCTTGRV